ncbi:unnamed protein product, partial [Rotaria magnacalcarata]
IGRTTSPTAGKL